MLKGNLKKVGKEYKAGGLRVRGVENGYGMCVGGVGFSQLNS